MVAKKRCGAKLRKRDEYCERWPSKGSNRCYLHGGRAIAGPEHPSFKHGRYSKHLPTHLMSAYKDAVGDPELLELRSDAAMIHTFMAEALGRMDGTASTPLWKQAQSAYDAFNAALRIGDRRRMGEALEELEAIIESGKGMAAGRDEIRELVQERRRIVESERKRLVDMHQMISAERAATLFAALLDIVARHVTVEQLRHIRGEAMGLFQASEGSP